MSSLFLKQGRPKNGYHHVVVQLHKSAMSTKKWMIYQATVTLEKFMYDYGWTISCITVVDLHGGIRYVPKNGPFSMRRSICRNARRPRKWTILSIMQFRCKYALSLQNGRFGMLQSICRNTTCPRK